MENILNLKQNCPLQIFLPLTPMGGKIIMLFNHSAISSGRRIQVGWMAGSEFKGTPFNQEFAFPRELTLKTTREGIRLCGVPVREIEILHDKKQSWSNLTVKPEDNPFSSLKGELYHIISEFMIDKNTAEVFGFNLR